MARNYALVLVAAGAAAFGGWMAAAQTPLREQQPAPQPYTYTPPVQPPEVPLRLADLELALKVAEIEHGKDHPNLRTLKKKIEALREINRTHGLRADGSREETGRFKVTSTPQAAVLADTVTGDTWHLRAGPSAADGPVWVPIKRLPQEPLLQSAKGAEKAAAKPSR